MVDVPSSQLSPVGRSLITVFGLGFMRPAPGTWGSLPPAAVMAALSLVLTPMGPAWLWAWFAGCAAMVAVWSFACVRWGDHAEAVFNRKDPSQVVADEAAGMALTLLPLPLTFFHTPTRWEVIGLIAIGFVLWRLSDIIKPPPAYGLQAVPGGWGVLLDDLMAALYAALAMVFVGRVVLG